MSILTTGIKVTGKGFDIERRLLSPSANYLILLRQNKSGSGLTQLKRFDNGFIKRNNSFRNQSEFEIATLDNISSEVLLTSFIGYDGYLYSVSEGDIVPPDSTRFTWLIYGRIRNTSFTPE